MKSKKVYRYKVVLYRYDILKHFFKKEEIIVCSSSIFNTLKHIYSNEIIRIDNIEVLNKKIDMEDFL